MGTGTSTFGKKSGKKTHIMCRRCGRRSYHATKATCASCGFGKTKKIRKYNWSNKLRNHSARKPFRSTKKVKPKMQLFI